METRNTEEKSFVVAMERLRADFSPEAYDFGCPLVPLLEDANDPVARKPSNVAGWGALRPVTFTIILLLLGFRFNYYQANTQLVGGLASMMEEFDSYRGLPNRNITSEAGWQRAMKDAGIWDEPNIHAYLEEALMQKRLRDIELEVKDLGNRANFPIIFAYQTDKVWRTTNHWPPDIVPPDFNELVRTRHAYITDALLTGLVCTV